MGVFVFSTGRMELFGSYRVNLVPLTHLENSLPRLLSPSDVSTFRDRLCQAAERLFAEQGPSGVTMRQLAVELGCSPMTPYRYFKDKEEILAVVRAAAFERLAASLERAGEKTRHLDVEGASRTLARAYVDFVKAEPHAYRLMFDLSQPKESVYPALAAASARAREAVRSQIAKADRGRHTADELDRLAEAQWAAVHGALMLDLAGKLPANLEISELVESVMTRLARTLGGLQEKLLVGGF